MAAFVPSAWTIPHPYNPKSYLLICKYLLALPKTEGAVRIPTATRPTQADISSKCRLWKLVSTIVLSLASTSLAASVHIPQELASVLAASLTSEMHRNALSNCPACRVPFSASTECGRQAIKGTL
ncbi:unnamed protein product [Ixodes pacificus]